VTDQDDSLDPIIDILREPAELRSDLTERVMSAIEREPSPTAARRAGFAGGAGSGASG
jgi:negative regulator of sigma E activity